MPTYQYECESCEFSFEKLQSMVDAKLKTCPECGKESLVRLIGTGGGVIFKGSGFYETDYKKKDAPVEGSQAGAKAGPAPKEAATAPSDT